MLGSGLLLVHTLVLHVGLHVIETYIHQPMFIIEQMLKITHMLYNGLSDSVVLTFIAGNDHRHCPEHARSIMASRTCVEECNRLRRAFRPDLAMYELPIAKSKKKRKMTAGVVVPPAKRQCNKASKVRKTTAAASDAAKKQCNKASKVRKTTADFVIPPAKRQCKVERNVPSNVRKPTVKKAACLIVDDPENPGNNLGEKFPFNPLDEVEQKSVCSLLQIQYNSRNTVSAGGPDIALTPPDLNSLIDTLGDGACNPGELTWSSLHWPTCSGEGCLSAQE